MNISDGTKKYRFHSSLTKRLRFGCVALLGLSLLPGCNGSTGKYPVSGTVTWNGTPVKSGFIAFIPADGAAPEAGEIRDGRFDFEARPGKSRVEIHANKEAGFNKSMNQQNLVQYLPLQYNTESTLSKDVSIDGENVFEFALTEQKP